MRVALVGTYPVDRTQILGGVQSAFAYLVDGLCQQDGLEIHVITSLKDISERQRLVQNGVLLHVLPPPHRFSLLTSYRAFRRTVHDELDRIKPDVVHAQEETHYGHACLKSDYPVVITLGHGIPREDAKHNENWKGRFREEIFYLLIERYCLRHARYLITVSHYATDYYRSVISPHARIYHIANAISQKFFNLMDFSDGKTILFAGRVMRLKRVLNLVRAVAEISRHVPNVQLRIAGECQTEPEYVATIRAFIREAGLDEQVHLLGQLSEQEILVEFVDCTLLALPSVQESSPMVVEQAMAAGKPVVATAVGGVPDMVEDGYTGFLVNVDDVVGLAEAIRRLLQQPELGRRMGQAGKEKALQNYSAAIVARRTYEVYRQIVADEG
jgi:glycosyltransferase involved in cell wall biosynthesis